MTTMARQRRKNNAAPWHTPLPLSPKRRAASANSIAAGRSTFDAAMFLSLLCMILFFAIFSTPFDSTQLPSNEKKSIFRRRKHSSKSSSHQINRGLYGHHESTGSMKYVSLPEISSSSRQYDVIVVGCGPAGLTAALFASRMGMSVLVLGSPSTGSLSGTSSFDNFPSFFGHAGGGQGWIDTTMEQASFFGAQFAPPAIIATGLVKTKVRQDDVFEIHLGADASAELSVLGKTVIVASGSVPRRLNLPHETSLWGHSIHNCALCDGDAYVRNNAKKSVAVIGGGDAAVEAIFLLHKLGVDTIHWIHRREEYRASPIEVGRVSQLTNVDVWAPYVVVEWIVKEENASNGTEGGDPAPPKFEGLRIIAAKDGVADPEAVSSLTIPCDGTFLMIGSTPNSKWLESSGVNIDPVSKLIRLPPLVEGASSDGNRSESMPQFTTSSSTEGGVFAAGEVVDGVYRQALTAASDGAKAAIDVQRYLRRSGTEASVPARSTETTKDDGNDTKKGHEISTRDQSEKKVVVGPSDCDLTKPDCINSVVSTHPVVVFSKNYCPHCRRALEALRTLTEPFVIDITEIRDGMKVQRTLESLTGRRTVPNVFIGGESIGGGDETITLFRDGKLGGLLLKARMKQ